MTDRKQRTIELTVRVTGSERERLMAELSELGFTGFLEEPAELRAYIPEPAWTPERRAAVKARLAAVEVGLDTEERALEPENWNARWEASLEPLPVGRFLVMPGRGEPPPEHTGLIVLEIEPRMSFGTGHHETTRLVLRALPELVRPGCRVLDAGTGSGILAIAAAKLGAGSAVAFDVDEWAEENATENFRRNGVEDRIELRRGTLTVVPEDDFDLVLANIQLDTLLQMIGELAAKTRAGGHLVLSGVLASESGTMLAAARKCGLASVDEFVEGEWWSGVLRAGRG